MWQYWQPIWYEPVWMTWLKKIGCTGPSRVAAMGSTYVISPVERGVRVTLGSMSDQFLAPGLGQPARAEVLDRQRVEAEHVQGHQGVI